MFVKTKRINGLEYCYMIQPYRKRGKVRHYQKYLGKDGVVEADEQFLRSQLFSLAYEICHHLRTHPEASKLALKLSDQVAAIIPKEFGTVRVSVRLKELYLFFGLTE